MIRALVAVSQALLPENGPRPRREQPPNAGKPWAAEDDARLESAFAAGIEAKQIALDLGRTPFGVESRLVKLGKLPPRGGLRFASA